MNMDQDIIDNQCPMTINRPAKPLNRVSHTFQNSTTSQGLIFKNKSLCETFYIHTTANYKVSFYEPELAKQINVYF